MDTDIKSAFGSITAAVESLYPRMETLDTNQKKIQTQVDAIDAKIAQRQVGGAGDDEGKSIAQELFEAPEIKHLADTGRGRVAIKIADFQKKSAITDAALGFGTAGVIAGQRLSGIIPAAMRTYRVRQLLRTPKTEAGVIDFVKVTAYSKASPAAESSTKLEATISFAAASERLKVLAHHVPLSNQALSDLPALEEVVRAHLLGGLYDAEDEELLHGSGTGEHLNGLCTQAEAFNTALLSGSDGYEYSDVIGRALQQLETSRHRGTAVVMHPFIWWHIVLTKDTLGRYIHGLNPTLVSPSAK